MDTTPRVHGGFHSVVEEDHPYIFIDSCMQIWPDADFAVAHKHGVTAYGVTAFEPNDPLERVLESPQARHPGKLRHLSYRGLEFDAPEFPGDGEVAPGLPPPELGEHTLALLGELGFDEAQRAALVEKRAVGVVDPEAFAWAPVQPKA